MERIRFDGMEPPTQIRTSARPDAVDYSDALAAFTAPSPVVEYLVVADDDEFGAIGVVAAIDEDPGDLAVLGAEPDDVDYYTLGLALKSDTHPWWGAFDHQYKTRSGRTGRLYVAFPFTPAAVKALAAGMSFGVAERSAVESDAAAPTVVIPVDADWWAATVAEWQASGTAPFVAE